jgi:hypothetical protein
MVRRIPQSTQAIQDQEGQKYREFRRNWNSGWVRWKGINGRSN